MTFAERFDSYYSARQSFNAYLELRGYRPEGDRTLWEPTCEADIEPDANYGPGAMQVGELADYFSNNDEPWLADESLIEPEEF